MKIKPSEQIFTQWINNFKVSETFLSAARQRRVRSISDPKLKSAESTMPCTAVVPVEQRLCRKTHLPCRGRDIPTWAHKYETRAGRRQRFLTLPLIHLYPVSYFQQAVKILSTAQVHAHGQSIAQEEICRDQNPLRMSIVLDRTPFQNMMIMQL